MLHAYFIGKHFIFMHDKAKAHTVSVVRDYVTEVGISIMKWPARDRNTAKPDATTFDRDSHPYDEDP